MTFGQRIQEMRKEKNLSQDALAKMLYVTRQSVSQWENDKAMPSVDLLLKLSQIFGVTVDTLLGNDNSEEQPKGTGMVALDKKEIRLAASYKFASTVSALLCSALAVIISSIMSSSIWQSAYKGINYNIRFVDKLENILILGILFSVAAVLVILRVLFYKHAKAFAKNLSGKILFYSDRFTVADNKGETISYFYAALRKVYENDNYFYLTAQNRNCFIIDKSSVDNLEFISGALSLHNNYHKKLLIRKGKRNVSARKARTLIFVDNLVFITAIALAICFSYIIAMLLTNDVLTGVKGFCLFILPIAASVFAVVFGVILTVRKIRAKRLIFAGIGALAFLIIYFSFSFIYFTVFNFNKYALPPESFLALMDDNNFTVEEANKKHLEDFLWECYEAVDENGIKITYMHFMEDVKNPAAYSAKTAYDGFVTDEQNKAASGKIYCFLNLTLNDYYTHYSDKGEYCYISQNRYTVIYISAESEDKSRIEEIFKDYKMIIPF